MGNCRSKHAPSKKKPPKKGIKQVWQKKIKKIHIKMRRLLDAGRFASLQQPLKKRPKREGKKKYKNSKSTTEQGSQKSKASRPIHTAVDVPSRRFKRSQSSDAH